MQPLDNYKIFEDSVHGHIIIPEDYCHKIIDNWMFQRLRRIEQTSMRPIFPSAHHDRFIHSIGVFHVGERMFSHIQQNTLKYNSSAYNFIKNGLTPTPFVAFFDKIKPSEDGFWSTLKKTYVIACLLHDCGHAPFSHTLESYYYNESAAIDEDILTIPLNQNLIEEYASCVKNMTELGESEKNKIIEDFKRDLRKCNAKPHELVSAWLSLHEKGFRNAIIDEKIQADPLLIARMITGCKFRDAKNPNIDSINPSEQILNCFIGILNGHEIDADRLDYAIRDKWATGLNTATINLERILSSMYITNKSKIPTEHQYIICFRKKGLPELQGLLDVKNFTSFWIFNHHKVKYNEELLVKAVKKLSLLYSREGETNNKIKTYIDIKNSDSLDALQKKEAIDTLENNAMYSFVDYKNLIEPQELVVNIGQRNYFDSLFLMSDDDVVHLLKKYFCVERKGIEESYLIDFFENATYAKEWFSRDQVLVPIWKSYTEYNARYLKPFVLELDSITRMLKCVDLLSTSNSKKMRKYEDILSSDSKIKFLISEIESYGRTPAVKVILNKFKTTPSDSLHNKICSELERAKLYYAEKDSIEAIMKKISIEIINKIKSEKFIIKPEIDSPKIIQIEKLNINEISPNSVYVEMNEDLFCYTELNLPQKNKKQNYIFFYIFMPRIFDETGEVELADRRKLYREEFRKMLHSASYDIS